MFNLIKFIETIAYRIRDIVWNYPELLVGEDSLRTKAVYLYKAFIPYSHFIGSAALTLFITILFFGGVYGNVVGGNRSTLIEGVVMGSDATGNIQNIGKVDPLRPSNIQLERDISELVYEPLIKFEYVENADGSFSTHVRNILAENVVRIRQGADYQFNLKRGVFWHDGRPFTSDDVIQTFEFVSQLEANNAYIRAVKQLRWEKLDDYNIRVCTRASEEKTCEQSQDNPILSNFLELISIKIVPAHKLEGVDPTKIDIIQPELFRVPVGTGRYKFFSVGDRVITLQRNENYHTPALIPSINTIQFKLFKTFEDGVKALENGEIHTLPAVSVQYKQNLEDFPQITANLSPVLDNQYWAIYFNLRKDPSGNTIGLPFFQDVKVRQAISSAINRSSIISNALLGVGQEAIGPIPSKSSFFNKNANWYRYNVEKAEQLLDEAGWLLRGRNKYRTNDKGEELSFSLYFVESFDRVNVAKSIQNDLENIGVKVVIDRRDQPGQDSSPTAPSGWSLNEINNQYLLPRTFDAILYGMYTFIDPDRYELFHSSQSKDPGLNISGYTGSVPTVQIRPNRQEGESALITVPKVDRLLEETRALDPDRDADKRKQNYDEFQSLIAEDAPVVFLYHPQFIYYSNVNVRDIDLANVASLEDRFRNIEKWVLE